MYNGGASAGGSVVTQRGVVVGGGRGPALTIDVQGGAGKGRMEAQQRALAHQQEQLQYVHQEPHSHMEEDGEESDHSDEDMQHMHMHQQQQQHQHHQGREDEITSRDEGMIEDEHEDDVEGDESFSDSMSSSPSIPDEDIDFALVYALHTFLATVDGQASVVKGDKLLLLDDTNSYWWLVRVLKTQAVGYIPAENIETPFERLARLNKHRNVDLTSVIPADYVSGPSSTIAQHRFATRIPPSQQPPPHISQHPTARGFPASPSHKDHPNNILEDTRPERSHSSKAKTVGFVAPIYYEHSMNGLSEDEFEEGEEGAIYDEEMEGEEGQLRGEQVFDDDDGDESEFSDENLTEDVDDGTQIVQQGQHDARKPELVQGSHHHLLQEEGEDGGDEGDWEDDEAPRLGQKNQAPAQNTLNGIKSQNRSAHQMQVQRDQEALLEQQRAQERQIAQQRLGMGQPDNSRTSVEDARRPSESSLRSMEDGAFDPDAPTKKLTATPPIVRDPTFDMNNPLGTQPPKVVAASPTPQRVRGVEVIDPRDPRYSKLISDRKAGDQFEQRRPSGEHPAYEADNSMQSIDTLSSSVVSGTSAVSEDSYARPQALAPTTPGLTTSKKLKKGSKEPADGNVSGDSSEKKRKSGGILGLFRKKDKKRKDESDGARSSEEIARPDPHSSRQDAPATSAAPIAARVPSERSSSAQKRLSQTGESMFGTDAALRQQEVEAKQAMYHQYGISRAPGDVSNSMTPRSVSMQSQTLSVNGTSSSQTGQQRIRPGSLIGSPSIPGLEVPLLSVLRVFAGDNIESEATFKTVLLNSTTTTDDLVKQSMQRFRLTGLEDRSDYDLIIRELGGEERVLGDDEKPLLVFDALSDQAGDGSGHSAPHVKRSSIGSINSISSNLSLNPAITRLGMNDFSDDSAVKLYLHKRLPEQINNSVATSGSDNVGAANDGLSPDYNAPVASPSFRFAARIQIHPQDLPENVVFDPQSEAIIPREVLLDRQQRNSTSSTDPYSPEARERIIFFPKNATVSEVIEAGVDRFGIVDAVVEGGDEVEDRVSRRRSNNRVKYCLAVVKDGQETQLNSSSKIVDAYSTPPLFRPYDRSSKEFRRRSVDATLILGSSQDTQPHDPVFVIRRAPQRTFSGSHRSSVAGMSPRIQEEDEGSPFEQLNTTGDRAAPLARQDTFASLASTASGNSVYATPADERTQELLARAASPQATRQEIIAAQRAISRANQRAILSAQKNTEQGVDIIVADKGTIRSSRRISDNQVRYSYIDGEGRETDISGIIETEWGNERNRYPRSSSRQTVTTEDSYQTARSPVSSEARNSSADDDAIDEEERQAISALRSTRVDIDHSRSTGEKSFSVVSDAYRSGQTGEGDVLQDALRSRAVSSPLLNESLQERLDRVLAKVREDRAMGRVSPRPRLASVNGRMSPSSDRASPSGGTRSPALNAPQGRRSPLVNGGRDSPSIDQLINRPRSSASHAKKPSITSISSAHSARSSATTNTDQPSTPVTSGSNGNNFTPISSINSHNRAPVAYRDDFGFDSLVALVDAETRPRSSRARLNTSSDSLFGHSLEELDVRPEVKSWYAAPSKTLDDLDARLDALLAQVVHV